MDPSRMHENEDQPRPMRAGRFTRLLLGATGIVVVAAGSQCHLVDQEPVALLGDPISTESVWLSEYPISWDNIYEE